ncbi:MAG: biotin/lipoyl-binding protein, partial [Sneathiella sp.]|nr:biotin/lipoyl-binding protein [Sneathiella sp.]
MAKPLKHIAIDQEKYRTDSLTLEKGKPESARLGQSIMLEEAGPAPLLRTAILFCFTILVAFLVWAQFAEIDEVSVASGEVIPSGTVQTIQHIDGGTISDIAIAEGDIVQKGQILLRLDQTDVQAQLKQLNTQQSLGRLKIERLRAFTQNDQMQDSVVDERFISFRKEQHNLLKIQRLDLKNQQNVLLSQIDQRMTELELLKDQIRMLKEQIAPMREQMQIREGLLKNSTLS